MQIKDPFGSLTSICPSVFFVHVSILDIFWTELKFGGMVSYDPLTPQF